MSNNQELNQKLQTYSPEFVSKILKSFLIFAVILFPILFFIEDNVKYFLYAFSLVFCGLLFFSTLNKEYYFKISLTRLRYFIDYFFISSSLLIMIFSFFQNNQPELLLPFTLLTVFLVPGWVFLRFLELKKPDFSIFKNIVLSFSFSFIFTPLIFLTQFQSHTPELLSAIFFTVSLFPLIVNNLQNHQTRLNPKIECNLQDALLLAGIIAFIVSINLLLYPQMSNVLGNDIVRHYNWINEILVTPELYGEIYPWFHFVEASIVTISNSPYWLFHTGTTLFTIFIVFSFYLMSKEYLSDIDKRAHRLATIFFALFSGFGWIFFLQQKLSLVGIDSFELLNLSRFASFWDVESGQSLFFLLWFRPVTIGFTLFFITLYIIKSKNLSSRTTILLTSLLLLSLSQIHFSELIIFACLIFVISLIKPKIKLRIKEASLSLLIALSCSTLITIISQNLFSSNFQPISFTYVPFIVVFAIISYLLCHFNKRPKISIHFNSKVAISVGFFFFFILLSFWFTNSSVFDYQELVNINPVPWEFYPMLLGIVGVFAIPSSVKVLKKYRNHPVIIFILLLFLTIVLGKLITFVNSELLYSNYWERRMIPMLFVAVSMLAPLTVFWFLKKFNFNSFFKNYSTYFKILFFSLIILFGTLSTLLSIEYQILSNEELSLKEDDFKIMESLISLDPYSTVFTVTPTSRDIVHFGIQGQVLDSETFKIWDLKNPEFPLTALSSLGTSSMFFLSEIDSSEILLNYNDGYLGSHLTKRIPILNESSGNMILKMPPFNPPMVSAENVLVLPETKEEFYNVYDVLSLAKIKYSTSLLDDINNYRNAEILFVPDDATAEKIIKYKENHKLDFKKLIILNALQPTNSTNINFAISDESIIKKINSKEWTTSSRGNGTVGLPKINNFESSKINSNFTQFTVPLGNFQEWELSTNFSEPIDLTNMEYSKFLWHGKNDGNWYELLFHSQNNNFFWYRFQDSWDGWKIVVIPLKIEDGTRKIFDVTVHKSTDTEPTWNNITKISFRSNDKNSTGVYFIDGFIFDKKIEVSQISLPSGDIITLPDSIELIQTTNKNSFETLTWFENTNIPFISKKILNNFDLYHVNLKPLLQKTNDQFFLKAIYPEMSNIINFLEIEKDISTITKKMKLQHYDGGFFTYKNLEIFGNATLQSNSTIIEELSSPVEIIIDERKYIFKNVTKIIPIDTKFSNINSNKLIIEGGPSFYSIILSNSSVIRYFGDPVIIDLVSNDESSQTIIGNELKIFLTNAKIFQFQPHVNSNGSMKITEINGHGPLRNKFHSVNQDITFIGNAKFNNLYPDTHSFADNALFEGKIIHSEKLYSYNEIEELKNVFNFPNLIYVAIIGIALITINFTIYLRKK